MKKMGKILGLLLVLCSITVTIPFSKVRAENDDLSDAAGIDVVMVIDSSKSMKKSDSNNITVDAAKMFVDMMEIEGSRVGIVPFSGTIGEVTDIRSIDSVSDKKEIKSAIASLSGNYYDDTDIGLALKKSYSLLSKCSDVGNRKMILFFTDGAIDVEEVENRTKEQSLSDVEQAVSQAVDSGIRIYTIGLNADGSVDKELLKSIADKSSGQANIVNSADELPGIFNDIFADFINSKTVGSGDYVTDGEHYTEVPLEIPNGSVQEANIVMITSNKLQDVQMIDPEGDILDVNGKDIILSVSNKYSMLKLVSPEEGKWKLRFKGDRGCKVHINLIYNYKVTLTGEMEEQLQEDGTVILELKGYFTKEGEIITDDALYKSFKVKAVIEKDEEAAAPVDLELKDGIFTGEVKLTEAGKYSIYLDGQGENAYRQSEVMNYKYDGIQNREPVFLEELPENIELSGFLSVFVKEKVDLSGMVSDADDDDIVLTAVSGDDSIASVNEENPFVVKAGKNGSTVIKITADDGKGGIAEAEIKVITDCIITGWIPVVAGIAALILAVIIIVALVNTIKKNNKKCRGRLEWEIVNPEHSGPQVWRDFSYKKGTVTLNLMAGGARVPMGLNRVSVEMDGKANNRILIKNKSANVMYAGFGGSKISQKVLKNGESVILEGKNSSGVNTKMRITYRVGA